MKEALLYRKGSDKEVDCYLCSHHCHIADSMFGICGMRENRRGTLWTHAYGEVIAAHADPIEKKPLYHFLPGTASFSIATAGCNFQCGFCQNWQISQVSRKKDPALTGRPMTPSQIVEQTKSLQCPSISYTYTEPTIFFEYAYDTAQLAKSEGLFNVFVTNGFMTAEALETIKPYLDACNVDLKSFNDRFYKRICKGRLKPVLESIRLMKELGIWVEITTLIIPGENDGNSELSELAGFIAALDPNIPWHISRFHSDYDFMDRQSTPLETLRRARELGRQEGLRYIYIGNVPGESSDTICPGCKGVVISRRGFFGAETHLKDSVCPFCDQPIPGVFRAAPLAS